MTCRTQADWTRIANQLLAEERHAKAVFTRTHIHEAEAQHILYQPFRHSATLVRLALQLREQWRRDDAESS